MANMKGTYKHIIKRNAPRVQGQRIGKHKMWAQGRASDWEGNDDGAG